MKRKDFLEGATNNDQNHRILSWEALQLTTGNVVEFGSGHGSTPYFRRYCTDTKRGFRSYDNNKEWAEATGAILVNDNKWDEINLTDVDVLFIDHAPGEDRKFQIQKYKDIAKILVIHDTEPPADHGYQTRQYYPQFKYWVEIRSNGAWCTMVSNFVDLSSTHGKGNDGYDYIITNAK